MHVRTPPAHDAQSGPPPPLLLAVRQESEDALGPAAQVCTVRGSFLHLSLTLQAIAAAAWHMMHPDKNHHCLLFASKMQLRSATNEATMHLGW